MNKAHVGGQNSGVVQKQWLEGNRSGLLVTTVVQMCTWDLDQWLKGEKQWFGSKIYSGCGLETIGE